MGEPGSEVDGLVSQKVPAQAGVRYRFNGWSLWEPNYSGALSGVTDTLMELAFLDGSDNEIGTPVLLDLRTVQTANNVWREHVLNGLAPVGTVSVRVTAGMIDGYATSGQQTMFFDDFSLVVIPEPGTALLMSIAIMNSLMLSRARIVL